MNDRFEIIKNMVEDKYEFSNAVYLKYGGILSEALEEMNLDRDEEFENDTFKIVPYDWDGSDCTCYIDEEIENLPYNKDINESIIKYDRKHMHTIDCGSHDTNFYHKPTGVAVSWRKHVSRFEYINKTINIEDWEAIVEDCIKSVVGDRYTKVEKLQSRLSWLQERHLQVIKKLNESLDKDDTMSKYLIKECLWLDEEILIAKEFEV